MKRLQHKHLILLILLGINISLFWFKSPYFYEIYARHNKTFEQKKEPIELSYVSGLKSLALSYTPHYDKRLSNGLKQAFIEYSQLLIATTPNVTIKEEQLNKNNYQLEYNIQFAEKELAYHVIISNNSQLVRKDILALEKVTLNFIQDLLKLFPRLPIANHSKINTNDLMQLGEFNTITWFQELVKIEEDLRKNLNISANLTKISHLFSWLTLFKNTNARKMLSNTLATKAMSYHLLSCATSGQSHCESGLLLLALGYPNTAKLEFQKSTNNINQMLIAFIEQDFQTLQQHLRNSNKNQKLGQYLLARMYHKNGYSIKKDKFFKRFLNKYPDFLLAHTFIIDSGDIAIRKNHIHRYIITLLNQHFKITHQLLNGKNKKVETLNLIEWLKLPTLSKNNLPLKNTRIILSPHFLQYYIQEEMYTAILSLYEFHATKLAATDDANKIVFLVNKILPNTVISQALKLKQYLAQGLSNKIFTYIETINWRIADAYMMDLLLEVHIQWRNNMHVRPQVINLLHRYRKIENPNHYGALRQYYFFDAFAYTSYKKAYFDNALAADRYDYKTYEERLLNHPIDNEILSLGKQSISHVYNFILLLGLIYNENDRLQARKYFQQAINKEPSNYNAYTYLADSYLQDNQIKKAIQIWKKYLTFDNESLYAVIIKNNIGFEYLKMNKLDKAYALFKETQQSGHSKAVLGYAKIIEKQGNLIYAEILFKRNAKRYPSGEMPIELALFYLRNNDFDKAIKILQHYRQYQHPSYYFSLLIDFYNTHDDLMSVLKIVKAVENNAVDKWLMQALAIEFYDAKIYSLATELYFLLATNTNNPIQNQVYYFAPFYFQSALKLKKHLQPRTKIWNELFQIYNKKMPVHIIEYLGISMQNKQYYPEALFSFMRKYELSKNRRQVALVLAALSWQLGDKSSRTKKQLLKWNHSLQGWEHDRVAFLLDELNQDSFILKADTPSKQCQAHYFIGTIKADNGNTAVATEHLLLSLESNAKHMIEYIYAFNLLFKLAGMSL